MKDRSDDPSHIERTLLPRSYISLPCSLHTAGEILSHSHLSVKRQAGHSSGSGRISTHGAVGHRINPASLLHFLLVFNVHIQSELL